MREIWWQFGGVYRKNVINVSNSMQFHSCWPKHGPAHQQLDLNNRHNYLSG